jgi:hypothetical protein
VLLELSIAVPTPANTSTPLCALAIEEPMKRASAIGQIERTSFDTINLIIWICSTLIFGSAC